MKIYEELKLDISNTVVLSLIGGGGKTTTMFALGEELKNLNKKVLITTTTAIYNPDKGYDYYFLEDIGSFFKEGSITIFGDRIENGKLLGTIPEKIDRIIECNIFDYILIEADGSKGKPIKGYSYYEPVIPEKTTLTIGIIGLDSLGEKVEDIVHRPEIFTKVTNTNYSDVINEEIITKYVLSSKGIFGGTKGKKTLILNKAHNEKSILRGRRIRQILLNRGFEDDILVTDIKSKTFY